MNQSRATFFSTRSKRRLGRHFGTRPKCLRGANGRLTSLSGPVVESISTTILFHFCYGTPTYFRIRPFRPEFRPDGRPLSCLRGRRRLARRRPARKGRIIKENCWIRHVGPPQRSGGGGSDAAAGDAETGRPPAGAGRPLRLRRRRHVLRRLGGRQGPRPRRLHRPQRPGRVLGLVELRIRSLRRLHLARVSSSSITFFSTMPIKVHENTIESINQNGIHRFPWLVFFSLCNRNLNRRSESASFEQRWILDFGPLAKNDFAFGTLRFVAISPKLVTG